WAMVVVYEDPKLDQERMIRIEDGFERVGAGGALSRNRLLSGFSSAGNWDSFGQVTLGGEAAVSGDRFNVNANYANYNGRLPNNFFNGTVTYHNETPQNTRGWDVSIFSTPTPAGSTSLSTTFIANDGGYDAFINIVSAISVSTQRPVYEMETKVLNTAHVDVAGQRIPLNTELKYQIKIRNIGTGIPTSLKMEALLPKNLTYVGIDGSLPSGVSAPTSTPENGQTKLTFNMQPNSFAAGDPFLTIMLKVKTTNDCNALRDACSNKLDFQPKLIYNTVNPTETNRETLSHKAAADCKPAPTTFYIEDAPCALVGSNTLPYCSAMELDGGAGYTSYSWTKQGQGVVGNSQKYTVTGVGTYILTRTGGTCNQVSTITYNIQPRSGNAALHPLRANSAVTAKEVCNNTGLDYLQIAVCGAQVYLTADVPAGSEVKWFKYTGTTSTTASCPPTPIPAARGSWAEKATGLAYTLPATEVATDTNGGTHFGITVKTPGNCEMDYYFGASRSNDPGFILEKRNITALACSGGSAQNKGWLKISGIPDMNYQYKVVGNSNAVDWTNVPALSFNHEVTAAGNYIVLFRKKLPNGASQYQNNVCGFEKLATVLATSSGNGADANFTLTKTDVLCVGNNPSGGKLKVQLSSDVTLPVKVIVERRGTPNTSVAEYEVNTDAERNSENTTAAAALASLIKGTYEVKLQVTEGTNTCTSPIREIEIVEKPELKLLTANPEDPSCGPTKKISVTYQGGTPNYTLTLSGTGINTITANNGTNTTHTFSINDPAFTTGTKNYTLELKDANGCTVRRDVAYTIQPKPTFTLTKVQDADCEPTSGMLKITSINPSFDLSKYEITYAIQKKVGSAYPTNGSWTRQATETFTGLTAGEYRARIYYKRGTKECSYPEEPYRELDDHGNWVTTSGIDYQDITATIAEGAGPLQAFAMVSHLACIDNAGNGTNPAGHAHASIKLSNLSGGNGTGGGVGPANKYNIKINNGPWNGVPTTLTGVTFNAAELRFDGLKPGAYEIIVESSNPPAGATACNKSLTIQVEQPIQAPQITPTIVYDCAGAAQVTYTSDRTDYSYHIETRANGTTPPGEYVGNYDRIGSVGKQTFTVADAGNSKVSRIFYKKTVTPKKLLFREDFGEGPTTNFAGLGRDPATTSISPNFTYHDCAANPNQYMITNYAEHHQKWFSPSACSYHGGTSNQRLWVADAPKDHTSNGAKDKGRFMFVDMGSNLGQGETLYEKIVDIEPNAPIGFEVYVFNLNKDTPRNHEYCGVLEKPDIRVRVLDAVTNTPLGQITSGSIPYNTQGSLEWVRVSSDDIGEINPGNVTRVKIQIQNTRNHWCGNDFAIDDIEVWQGPMHCPTRYVDVALTLASGKQLSMTTPVPVEESCYGANDGKVSTRVSNFGANYKWYLTAQGNTTKLREGTKTDENLSLTNLAPGNYTLHIVDTRQAKFADNQPCDISQDFVIKRNPQLNVVQNKTVDYFNCDVDRAYVVIFGQNGSRQN
ncbi:hypothetical protein HMPREF1551_02064, partial [Capnocytophaga sp. oral taxon 863 str. F0517]|uniref:hypothetical protein n=1 Tax=Capnocytophaga sp. oral taxon 863 TaxID=1227265 RepID=UPI00039720EC